MSGDSLPTKLPPYALVLRVPLVASVLSPSLLTLGLLSSLPARLLALVARLCALLTLLCALDTPLGARLGLGALLTRLAALDLPPGTLVVPATLGAPSVTSVGAASIILLVGALLRALAGAAVMVRRSELVS